MSFIAQLVTGLVGSVSVSAIPVVGPVVAFLSTRLGRMVLVGVVFVAVIGVAWNKGRQYADAKCDRAVVQSKLDAAQKDLAAEKKARAAERVTIVELTDQKRTAESRNDDLEREIAKLPKADQCIITPDRARRMR